MPRAFSEIAFTPAVRARQQQLGSAAAYGKFLTSGPRQGHILSEAESAFIEARDGFYQATVSETGWPYVQFRGGPAGFLRVSDPQTIVYADLRGNRQYISLGNLSGNDRVSLILMDYANAARLKIWGRAQIVEPDMAEWSERAPDPLPAKTERLVKIHVEAFDWNCPQHIPRRYTEDELRPHLAEIGAELARLRAENIRLSAQLGVQES